ncbi:hypothetical protein [Mastigocladopsis repens]|uniref:hypothetical protein n=1 Tax=Mastigocladopsis repens TaxID=221287 RepID=UPI0003174AFC|nr:hypothetical protein [Mastigocladopsis repens]
MNVDKKLAATISGVVCFLTTMSAAPVLAATFNFSYTGVSVISPTDTVTASGVLTTDPYDPATDTYQITDITGTRNGVEIDSLLSPNTFPDNNNVLYADSLQLDEFGFSYTAGGMSYNVFDTYQYIEIGYTGTDYGDSSTIPVNIAYPLTSFSITRVTPVPESSSMLGILGISVLAGGSLVKRLHPNFSRASKNSSKLS